MHCPNCEAENKDSARFCNDCGFPLDGSMTRPRFDGEAPARGGRTDDAEQDEGRLHDDSEEREPLEDGPCESEEALNAQEDSEEEPQEEPDSADESGLTPEELDKTSAFEALYGDDERAETADSAEPVSNQETRELTAAHTTMAGMPAAIDITMEMPRIDPDAPYETRDFRADSNVPQKKGKKKIAIVLACIAVAAALIAGVTYYFGLWGGVVVPDVKGMTEADASRVLSDSGFDVRSAKVKSDETEGLVLISDPEAGSRIPEKSEVVIHVATTRFVPSVVGLSKEACAAALKDEGYEKVTYATESSDEPEGTVLAVSPEAGTRAKSNVEVTVTLAEPYRVPSISGQSLYEAMDTITEAGLNPQVVYIDTDQFYDGTIIGTNPEAGSVVSGGDYVTISVARTRGYELTALTNSLFAPGNTVTVGGVNYEIQSLVSTSYLGNDTVAYTAVGRPKITFFGETLYASLSQTIAGQVVFNANNEVVSIS